MPLTITSLSPTPVPANYLGAGLRRFTVAEYRRMIEAGVLLCSERVELLEGFVVHKARQSPLCANTSSLLHDWLFRNDPPGWQARAVTALTLADSEPEPDAAVVRNLGREYMTRHPGPADVGLVVEVADITLAKDRLDKARIYARANLPVYWIINVVDRQVEVYTDPRPADPVPSYATRTDYRAGDAVPLVLDGRPVARLSVDELLG